VRWLALADAARMGRQWLLVPLFAMVALFLPPPIMQQFPSAAIAYLILLAVLWLVTLLLYLIWCVRLCRTVGRSGALAFLLFFPLLDYIALVVLAFSEGKPSPSAAAGPLKNPVLAI
jgi:uncharacterized membrane protein YhaH (DUF805 family)